MDEMTKDVSAEAAAANTASAFAEYLSPNLFARVLKEPLGSKVVNAHTNAEIGHFRDALHNGFDFGLRDFLGLLRDRTWRSSDEIEFLPDGREGRSEALWAASVGEHGVLTLDRLLMLRGQRASIYVKGLQFMAQPMREAAQRMSSSGYFSAHINAFLTPAAAQSTPYHYDHHDVMAIQVHGSKVWDVSKGPRAPNPHADFAPSAQIDTASIEPEQIRMEQGDALFLPRGVIHRAGATDQASFHLVFGLKSVTWADVLQFAVEQAAGQESALRADCAGPAPSELAALIAGFASAEMMDDWARKFMKTQAKRQLTTQYGQVFAKDLDQLIK
jgi:hypothetical protein